MTNDQRYDIAIASQDRSSHVRSGKLGLRITVGNDTSFNAKIIHLGFSKSVHCIMQVIDSYSNTLLSLDTLDMYVRPLLWIWHDQNILIGFVS